MLFTELPFLDRFDAAASAGFEGVEFLFPYEYETDDLAARFFLLAIMPGELRQRPAPHRFVKLRELARHGAVIEENPHGSFGAVGTMCSTVSLWLTKVA